jgi:peptide chain release factor 3
LLAKFVAFEGTGLRITQYHVAGAGAVQRRKAGDLPLHANLAEEAWPGDIIGIPNHGLTEGEPLHITGIPNFAPEILRRVKVDDPMKSKHLKHALGQLAEEGVTRVFKPLTGGDWIVGVVGGLQLDVLKARLEAEYDLATRLDGAPYQAARWLEAENRGELERFRIKNPSARAEDPTGCRVSCPGTAGICAR